MRSAAAAFAWEFRKPLRWGLIAVSVYFAVPAPVPLIWPGLFAAAFLAWLQALTWMPYGLPGLRMIVAVLLLTTIDAVVFTAIELHVRESLMILILAPQIPLAYLAARYALGQARCGVTPDWRGVFARLGRVADVLPRRRGRFP